MKVIRHLFSMILPIFALIVIPLLIENDFTLQSIWTSVFGFVFIGSGFTVLALTIRMFVLIGEGTLAPWDPTRKLVTCSLYGHVRNPMILGVLITLLGEAMLFTSFRIGAWAALFFIINTLYFICSEEPGLERRFGAEYVEYKQNVPRWIPRLEAWSPVKEDSCMLKK
ncbi:MAG TPA: isoprenylcysteine carboxylmethyltransferase family protein [Clostridiales bacterium]|nr:isoprenylcysteine carboxylmethyltransferase family protein [Clostridiales bacterium]